MLLALGLGPAACGRSCGCVEGEKTYERLDGKVKVSLVRKVQWTGGKVPNLHNDFVIRVETEPPFDEPVRGCDHVDLAEDEPGKHVAFRCKGTASWTVLRLRGGDRRIRECNATVGTGREPSFEKLESVRAAAPRILDCEGSDATYAIEQLVRGVAEDEGQEVAGDLVFTLAARPLSPTDASDPWEAALRALGPPGRERALAQLCGALRQAPAVASSETWVRAAVRCALDAPEIGAGSLAMLRRQLPEDGSSAPIDAGAGRGPLYADRALVWSALIATEKEPASAGAIACKAAGNYQRYEARGQEKAVVAWILGQTGTRCDAVSAWLSPPPCSSRLDCDGGLCSREELAAETARWTDALALDGGDGGVRKEPNLRPNDDERLTLFAAHVLGPLPREMILVNARRTYPFADAGAELSSCANDALDAGAPCACSDVPLWERCMLPASETRLRYAHCAVHFDDTRRHIDDVKRTCEPEGAKCNWSSILCCGGLRCEPGVGVCKKKPDGAPAAAPSAVGDGG